MTATSHPHIKAFFHEYLARQKGCRPNTITSYADALRLFLTFIADRRQIHADDIDFTTLTDGEVLAFFEHLEQNRHCSVSTRNQRLAALKALFHYLAARQPDTMLGIARSIASIRAKRGPHKLITGLENRHMQALLDTTDPRQPAGARDRLLFLLFHNTGARVQELADLTFADLRLDAPAQVILTGKGRKQRVVPLWPETVQAARHHRSLLQPASDGEHIFRNAHGNPITRFGIRHIVSRHAAAAARTSPQFAAIRVTPHVFRHTTALHLVQAGVDIVSVKEILGHADIKTTSLYVQIDLDTKRKAIEQCPAPAINGSSVKPQWQKTGILQWLRTLASPVPTQPRYVKLSCPYAPDVHPPSVDRLHITDHCT